MPIKCLEARCATGQEVRRTQIEFDTDSGLIVSVGKVNKDRAHLDYYFDDDCLLFAGMGDIHIHAREDISGKNNYKEDFKSTCLSCLNGGLVHAADMPNNPIPPIDEASYLAKVALAHKCELPLLMYAGIGPHTRPLRFSVPYKAYMGPSVGDLFFKNNNELEEAIKKYAHQWVSFHCEDPEILESHKMDADHFKRRPLEAELLATDVALKLIEKYQLKGKLCHYSAGRGLSAINAAKNRGVDVWCEVTPQHLYFSEEKIRKMPKDRQVLFQMNPPIRKNQEAQKLLEALKRDEIDVLATDHAPHSPEEKARGTSGLPGLDTYGPFVAWLLVEQQVAPTTIARMCSENPGRFFNQFYPGIMHLMKVPNVYGLGLGFLAENFSASFSVLNLKRSIKIEAGSLKTKASWSPFIGETLPGSLEALFFKGKRLR